MLALVGLDSIGKTCASTTFRPPRAFAESCCGLKVKVRVPRDAGLANGMTTSVSPSAMGEVR